MGQIVRATYARTFLFPPASISDQRLIERILHWFPGRHQFTASLIEVILRTPPGSQHRVLSAFVEAVNGFTITDAIDLEEAELPLTAETRNRLRHYAPVGCVEGLFTDAKELIPDGKDLIKFLFHAVIWRKIRSQATLLPIEGNMHETLVLGIGHLEKVEPDQSLEPAINYPVSLCEPLVVLYLSSLLEKQSLTTNQVWITHAFRTARRSSLLGFTFEEAVLLVLLQTFGGKSSALSYTFHCYQPWGSKKVTLVA